MADYTNRLSHFQREVQFAAGFRHPNIMRIHFSGSLFWHYDDSSERQPESYRSGDYNLPYYVTDDLPDSVEQRLRNGLFTSVVAVEIGKQVCEALEALHGADPSILHLDLNPSNVRLAEGGRVVITDFGLVRVEGIPQGEVTRETSWLPPYVAAPEQRAGEDLDIRTDIYQVGALLFLMVTGKTRREFAVMTLLEQPNVPQSLARVIERCTRHDKEMRFQDATRLKEALVSANPSSIDILRRLAHFLSRVDAHVSPVWENPVTWLLGAILVFAIVWELGWVLPPDPVTITIASSSTKKAWLNQAVKDFNEASRTDASLQLSGNPIRLRDKPIVVEHIREQIEQGPEDDYRSGSMIRDILAEGEKAAEAPGLLRTPLVIAMWQSRAEALGCWPNAGPDCTWETLRALATSTDGWGMFGHPEWGKLRYGYGFVGRSNSATFTEVLLCMSGLGIQSGLPSDLVRADSPCGEAMADLEEAETHVYARSALALDAMLQSGLGRDHLDAATTYERKS